MPEEPAKLEQQVGQEPAKFKNRETTPDQKLGRYSATESENYEK